MRTLTAFDVDVDALADTFDRMADGLRSGDVLVDELIAREVVSVEDAADFRFEMAYHATHGFVDVTDVIEYDVTHYLRFADEYVDPILRGDKTATVRVGFERDFDVGDVVDLIDTNDDKFAEATVAAVFEGPVESVVRNDFGHYEGVDPADFVDTLSEHYPEANVDGSTTVTAIEFYGVEGEPKAKATGAGE